MRRALCWLLGHRIEVHRAEELHCGVIVCGRCGAVRRAWAVHHADERDRAALAFLREHPGAVALAGDQTEALLSRYGLDVDGSGRLSQPGREAFAAQMLDEARHV